MSGRRNYIGATGEEIASEYLKLKGYKILALNSRTPFGELDIIARKDGFIIFVEVKTRASNSLGPPYLSVTKKKIRHLIKNSLCYLKRCGLDNSDWRIDIVSVKLNEKYDLEHIELIENAVQDEWV